MAWRLVIGTGTSRRVALVHVPARLQPERPARLLALTGGLIWIVKTVLIWQNGGTNRYDGTVGLMFMIGAVLLAAATVIWTWRATRNRPILVRGGLLLGALIVLFLAINLPILVGRTLFPRSWLADEFGVILVAVASIAAGGMSWPGTRTSTASGPGKA